MTDPISLRPGLAVQLPAEGDVLYKSPRKEPALSALREVAKSLTPPRVKGVSVPASLAYASETYVLGAGWSKNTAEKSRPDAPAEKRAEALSDFVKTANALLAGPTLVHETVGLRTYPYGKPPAVSLGKAPAKNGDALRLWRRRSRRWLETELGRLREGTPLIPEDMDNDPDAILFERVLGVLSQLPRPVPMIWGLAPDTGAQALSLVLLVPKTMSHVRMVLEARNTEIEIDKSACIPPKDHLIEVILSHSLAAAHAASLFLGDAKAVRVATAMLADWPEGAAFSQKPQPIVTVHITPSEMETAPSGPLTLDAFPHELGSFPGGPA
ncbi:hypothetical protein [Tropicibacter oceani]|uniref:Uncharacterized protein n=1 Tax=Tropicibacter oceani TaxID=3058420 RepID=A0ABY8QED0_9RHOB|nr:hypothetical protein [Tropicibacter oceani]WGW02859.1 hypothetical protein QF118_13045 [Tropicibacter oceani]